MPPKKATPPPNVARLTTDEQIGYLFHQHELSADWRLQVDERLCAGEEATQQLNVKVDSVERKVDSLSHRFDGRVNEVLVIQQQILIAVQGQRVPGLESPGINDRVREIEARVVANHATHHTRIEALHAAHQEAALLVSARRGWLAGAIAVGSIVVGVVGKYVYDLFMSLIPHTPIK